jgi:hypothetical protein
MGLNNIVIKKSLVRLLSDRFSTASSVVVVEKAIVKMAGAKSQRFKKERIQP